MTVLVFNLLTSQVSAELALGEQFNTVEQDTYRPLIKKMESIVSLVTYVYPFVSLCNYDQFEGFDIVGPLFGFLMSFPQLKAVCDFETVLFNTYDHWWKMVLDFAKKSLENGVNSVISDLKGQANSRDLVSHGSLFL